jgi:hypothetical protein
MKNYLFVFIGFLLFAACNSGNNTVTPVTTSPFLEVKVNGFLYRNETYLEFGEIFNANKWRYNLTSTKLVNGQSAEFALIFYRTNKTALPTTFDVVLDTAKINVGNGLMIISNQVGAKTFGLVTVSSWQGTVKLTVTKFAENKVTGTFSGLLIHRTLKDSILIESGKFENVPFIQ